MVAIPTAVGTQQQLLGLRELVLAGSQQTQGVADILIEHLAAYNADCSDKT